MALGMVNRAVGLPVVVAVGFGLASLGACGGGGGGGGGGGLAGSDAGTGGVGLGCGAGQKSCGGQCVSANDPQYGCAKPSCAPCAAAGGGLSPLCNAGACAYQDCTHGADCDGDPGNGCETLAWADPNNCGGCGIACSFASGLGTCAAGVCVDPGCDHGFTDCNLDASDGCEVETGSDDAGDCGACGRVCASGQCQDGACVGELVVDTGPVLAPVALVRDGATLYLALRGSGGSAAAKLASVPTAGGPLTELLPAAAGDVNDVLVDDAAVYVADGGGGLGLGRVYAVGKSGSCTPGPCPTVLADGRNFPHALAHDATHLYWIESGYFGQDDGGLYRMPKAGGAIQQLGTLSAFPSRLAFDGTSLWVASLQGITRVAADGSASETVLDPSLLYGAHAALEQAGGSLFYSTATLASGTILRLPKLGGTSSALGNVPAEAIRVDGAELFFTGQFPQERRKVYRMPVSGVCVPAAPCPVPLGHYDYNVSSYIVRPFALDATHVYFVEKTTAGGAVRKVTR